MSQTPLNNQELREDITYVLDTYEPGEVSVIRPDGTSYIDSAFLIAIDEIMALFTSHEKALLERLEAALPKEKDMNRYEGLGEDGGIDTTIFTDDEDPSGNKNGDMLAHLAQFADDTGYNKALADVRTIIGGKLNA